MCIIAVKKSGVKMPTRETLETCFKNNSDGCGYMYSHDGEVIIKKGFMDFKDFWNSLEYTKSKVNAVKTPFVFHFRISTQAGVNQGCTHPFPVSSDPNDMTKLRVKTKLGVAHNGIISLTSDYYSRKAKYSDTQLFIMNYLSSINKLNSKWYMKDDGLKLVENLIESKLAILDSNGFVNTIGEFVRGDDGLMYSNESFKKKREPKYSSYNYNSLMYDDYYGYIPTYDSAITKRFLMPLDSAEEYYIKSEDTEEFEILPSYVYAISFSNELYEIISGDEAELVCKYTELYASDGTKVTFNYKESETYKVI